MFSAQPLEERSLNLSYRLPSLANRFALPPQRVPTSSLPLAQLVIRTRVTRPADIRVTVCRCHGRIRSQGRRPHYCRFVQLGLFFVLATLPLRCRRFDTRRSFRPRVGRWQSRVYYIREWGPNGGGFRIEQGLDDSFGRRVGICDVVWMMFMFTSPPVAFWELVRRRVRCGISVISCFCLMLVRRYPLAMGFPAVPSFRSARNGARWPWPVS